MGCGSDIKVSKTDWAMTIQIFQQYLKQNLNDIQNISTIFKFFKFPSLMMCKKAAEKWIMALL